MVPRTGTRPREPKVFSTSKGMLMEQTSPPSFRLTTARKRLTEEFDDFSFEAFAPAFFVEAFFVAIGLSPFACGGSTFTRAARTARPARKRARAARALQARAARPRRRATAESRAPP